jgi:hypothetical protein
VEQAVENRGDEDLIAEELAPVDEAPIRGQDQTCLFVAPGDEQYLKKPMGRREGS